MKTRQILILLFFTCTCFSQQLPETKKIPATIKKYNITYQDDYAWVENYNSKEVKDWVDAENQLVAAHYETVYSGTTVPTSEKWDGRFFIGIMLDTRILNTLFNSRP